MTGGARHGGLSLGLVLGLALGGGGCELSPEEHAARLARLEAEEQQLDAALDALEVRLLGNQARLHLWGELERRHAQVSAIQCQVSEEHLKGMAAFLRRQEEKERLQRMASAAAVLSSALETPGEP